VPSVTTLLTVLVVDDHKFVADTIVLILKKHGFTVSVAYSGEEAVEIARQSAPDWLVSDIELGAVSGIDAAIQIREICPKCQIVLMSGNELTHHLLKDARSEGHEFDVLVKPFHPKELLRRLAA
jgi:CheY-like chemotaxis protein